MEMLGVDGVYIDRISGKNTDRPELKKMMEYVRHGDTVIVESISRFARNTRDLLDLVERLTAKGVEFVSQKEAIDTSTPTGKFMLTVFGSRAGAGVYLTAPERRHRARKSSGQVYWQKADYTPGV